MGRGDAGPTPGVLQERHVVDPDPSPCTAAMPGCNILTLQLVVWGKVWSGQGCALAIIAPEKSRDFSMHGGRWELNGLGRGDVFYMEMHLFF